MKKATGLLLEQLIRQHANWVRKTFPHQNVQGVMEHLKKEADEVIAHPEDKVEYSDCLILLLHAILKANISFDELVETAYAKLQVCKTRKWNTNGSPDEPMEHDRNYDARVNHPDIDSSCCPDEDLDDPETWRGIGES